MNTKDRINVNLSNIARISQGLPNSMFILFRVATLLSPEVCPRILYIYIHLVVRPADLFTSLERVH